MVPCPGDHLSHPMPWMAGSRGGCSPP